MDSKRWAHIEELFHRAVECDASQRSALLDHVCKDDLELRSEVEALLAYEPSAHSHVLTAARSEIADFGFPLAGEVVSHYRILDGLAGGGMGLVYRAEDVKLGRQVALKFLPEESAKDPASLSRFEREARAASGLEHPNICPIYEFGEHEGQPFLVMQLLEGNTLKELLEERRHDSSNLGTGLPVNQVLHLGIQIADGLDAAHQKGIIHRDIKPANIFVTSRGEAKILDFGLAKLAEDTRAIPEETSKSMTGENTPDSLSTPDPFLSRTGVAMGTAGYMSPEQARGEKLDSRTDLFSFGLVLYEMGTGQRAFPGRTGPKLHQAILEHAPVAARRLNTKLPARLETVINRALEKERTARYQCAAEIRADLLLAKREIDLRPRWWKLSAAALVLLFVSIAIFWYAEVRPTGSQPASEPKLTQLTFNSFENRVTSGMISPNGKYLAYTDTNGMYIKNIDTGTVTAIPKPEEQKLQWEVGPWFPDSERFVASAHPPSVTNPADLDFENTSTWVVSRLGGTRRKLRDRSDAFSVSPNGTFISFGTNKYREIWLMTSDGKQAHKVVQAEGAGSVCCLTFLPGGKRISYFVFEHLEQSGGTLVSRDLEGGPLVTLLTASERREKNIEESTQLPDGRLVYTMKESGVGWFPFTSSFWVTRFNPLTGKLIDQPRQITHQSGGWSENSVSGTADSKRLVFLRHDMRPTSYVGELTADGTRIRNLRHFPSTENVMAMDWTPDSKQLISFSSRPGDYQLYEHKLDDETQVPLVATGFGREASTTPDGKWVLYFGAGDRSIPRETRPLPLMRISIDGGAPTTLFVSKPGSSFGCARSPSTMCVISESSSDGKEVITSVLDPVKGRGPELNRFAIDPDDKSWGIGLSPDGLRIAANRGKERLIRILSLAGQPIQQVKVKGWSSWEGYTWAADGKGFYVSVSAGQGKSLLYVDFQGDARVLWNMPGASDENGATPSPDGRHLAIHTWTRDDNMWMVENF